MVGVKRLGLIAGLAVLGLAPATMAAGPAPAAVAAGAAAAPSSQDTQFLQGIHQVNLAEIATGNLAQQKGANQQVKELGARFVTDHTQLDQTVQSTARKVGVTLPNAPNSQQQAVHHQLEGLSGKSFDTAWVSTQLRGHMQAIQLVQSELSQGVDPSIKEVAQDALPVVEAHHEALVALAQRLGVPVPGATSGPPNPGLTGTPSPGGTSGTPSPGETSESPSGSPTLPSPSAS